MIAALYELLTAILVGALSGSVVMGDYLVAAVFLLVVVAVHRQANQRAKQKHQEWYFKVRPSRAKAPKESIEFLAWCARTPVLGDGPLDVDPAEEVYFQFGDTPECALHRLKQDLKQVYADV
jgi:hypothetical protein